MSSFLLLSACTSRDAPTEASDSAPAQAPEPTSSSTPAPSVEVETIAAPPGAELRWVRANACEDGAPMSLTASDGTGLRLAGLTARAVVEGPLAFTELRLSFDNPEPRQREGRFSITLPPGAAISRFAMEIDGRWQEGEVVERQAARVAYEDFLHRRQDPALLENDAGNVFRARVFPIPPNARKQLILSYSQQLVHEAEPYRLPVCGLPTLDRLDVDVAIVQGSRPSGDGGRGTSVYHLDLKREAFAPTKDLEARVGARPAQGLRHGDLAVARVVPVLETPDQPVEAMTILVDTSASRALDFRGQVARLETLVAALPDEARLHVVAYDQQSELIYSGRADTLRSSALDRLRDRGALGASDLGAALAALPAMGAVSPRLLLVGDGVVTAGVDEAGELQAGLRALVDGGLRRVDALVDGGIQDSAMLTALTRAGLEHDGVVLDARLEAEVVAARLGRATRSGLRVSVPGAEWVHPEVLDGVQSGDERLVYVQLPSDRGLKIELSDAGVRDPEPTLAVVPQPLLARAHARARIDALQAERAGLAADQTERRQALGAQIVSLSTRHRVLSDLTALLVLETEQDYARFGIDRRALADVLVAGPSGVEVMKRAGRSAPEPEPESEPEPEPMPRITLEAKSDHRLADAEKSKGSKRDEAGLSLGRVDRFADSPAPADGLAAAGGDGGDGGPAEEQPAPEPPASGDDLRPEVASPRGGGAGEPSRPAPARARRRPSRPASAVAPEAKAEDEDGDEEVDAWRPPPPARRSVRGPAGEAPMAAAPYEGRLARVMASIAAGALAEAEREAVAWRQESPGDVLALIARAEVHEAMGQSRRAARAYGSIIDLFPSRADMRRMAGERLERLGGPALALAIDTYAHAVAQRPDHPSSHRLYAYALLKAGRHAEAFAAIEASLARRYPGGRFAGVQPVLREDLGLIGAAWIAASPAARPTVEASLTRHGASLATKASTRFVLNWESDANDVDLHVYDAKGGHAFFSDKTLRSGGRLYADVTTGYGPECFTIEGKRRAGPYRVGAHYYRRGPMGYGMGKLQVVEHDGAGGLRFSEHPFVIMKDDAHVDLAVVGDALVEPPGHAPSVEVGGAPEHERDPTAPVIYRAR